MSAADDARVREARNRINAFPGDRMLPLLPATDLVVHAAVMHGAAVMLNAFVRDVQDSSEAEQASRLGRVRAAAVAEGPGSRGPSF